MQTYIPFSPLLPSKRYIRIFKDTRRAIEKGGQASVMRRDYRDLVCNLENMVVRGI